MANRTLTNTPSWTVCTGRNGQDPPHTLTPEEAAEAHNVMLLPRTLGRKRYGAVEQEITGTYNGFNVLARFQPGQDSGAAELHFVSRDGTPKIMRVAAGTAATELTLADAIQALPQNARWAVLNGKLFWAYDSAVNRLHVYDPVDGTVRRVGMAAPAAPTAGNTGSGSYAATPRYYRVRWLVIRSGRVQRQSNSSPATSFTPSGTGTGAVVTRPTAPAAPESLATHWQVEASEDDTAYYVISSQIVIATTTYTDVAAPSSYASNALAAEPGAYTPPLSARCLLSLGDQLLMYGVYEATSAAGDGMVPRTGTLYWTPVMGTSDETTGGDDDERISNTQTIRGRIAVAPNSNGEDRALAGPVDGIIYAFQSDSFNAFTRTSDYTNPFVRVPMDQITSAHGTISQECTFVGESRKGQACVYFCDPERGLYRIGGGEGLVYCGYDVLDIWRRINLQATGRVCVGIYDSTSRCVKLRIAIDDSNEPNYGLNLYVDVAQVTEDGVRGGWATWEGYQVGGRSMLMFAETFGVTMSRRNSPYVALEDVLLRTEVVSAEDDADELYEAYLVSRAFVAAPYITTKRIGQCYVQVATECCGVIHQQLIADFGAKLFDSEPVRIQPNEGEASRVLRWFSDARAANFFTFQVRLGDDREKRGTWWIDLWISTLDELGTLQGNQ